MFWRRALSIVVLLPLVLLIVYRGGWLYLLLISAVILVMQVEYCQLAQHFSEKLNVVMPTLPDGCFLPARVLLTDTNKNVIRFYGNVQFFYISTNLYLRRKYL